MKTFQNLLYELGACSEAREWASGKTIESIVSECHRGDWLLWLASRIKIDKRKLVLAKGKCAATVRHLMKDERSTKAVDAAIDFGNGNLGEEELRSAAAAAAGAAAAAAAAGAAGAYAAGAYAAAAAAAAYAAAAAAAAGAAAAYAAAAAADAAAAAADAAADAAAAAAAAAADAAAAAAARKQNRMQTADICREVIGQIIIDKVNSLLNS